MQQFFCLKLFSWHSEELAGLLQVTIYKEYQSKLTYRASPSVLRQSTEIG